MATGAELNYNTSATATEMAEAIFGDGVTVVSANYTGDPRASATYSNGDTLAPGATPADSGVILSTGQATGFTRSGGDPNRSTGQTTASNGLDNDPGFNAAAGGSTFDAAYLDVTFVPTGDQMTMQFVFASEEFPEFQSSQFQDAVVVWVNGQPVPMEVGNTVTNPQAVTGGGNSNFFLDNTNDDFNTEMDGLTVTLTLVMDVNPSTQNTIRIGIADVGDSSFDSNLLIAGDSIQTSLIANTDLTHVGPNDSKVVDVLANDESSTGSTLTITQINGQPVVAGSTVTLGTGQTVQLNADGTLTLTGDGDAEDFNFTYTVTDGATSAVGTVDASTIPCFVAGTLIRTPRGHLPVETLVPGDLVITRDRDAQPVRWAGARAVSGQGDLAPIRIAANTFGTHDEVRVSPQHRVLVRNAMAELLFGESEVLVAAKDLVDDHRITRCPTEMVTYVHIMFDQHEVIYSNGFASESFLPGPQTGAHFEREIIDELRRIFPELHPRSGRGYGPAARRSLSAHEGELLMQATARSGLRVG